MVALFVASVFVLGIKLLNPTPVQIFIEGQSASVTQLPGFFTLGDVVIIVIASIALGVSGTYLLFLDLAEKPAGELVLEERKKRWKEMAKTLKEGTNAKVLSFGKFKVYDALAPEFETYETIKELAQKKYGGEHEQK